MHVNFLSLQGMQYAAETKNGRLLCLLLIWVGAVSVGPGREWLPVQLTRALHITHRKRRLMLPRHNTCLRRGELLAAWCSFHERESPK